MHVIRLAGETDFDGWRRAARRLVIQNIAPEDVDWQVGESLALFPSEECFAESTADEREPLKVPRGFVTLAKYALLHSDAARFALLYRLLWRLKHEPRLLQLAGDADVVRANAMAEAVKRDIHKTHAFVRFRAVNDASGEIYIAWFEPVHHTLEAAAHFFVRRFATLRWSILTPRVSAHWDGATLQFGPGALRSEAPRGDALEALWRTYYASIFNPARLKTRTMQAHMPRRYWRSMPETELITELVARAAHHTGAMIEQPASVPRRRKPALPVAACGAESASELGPIRAQASRCTRCPLHLTATQTVFGEGPSRAAVMIVGEQPGDQEDIEGKPFVGPAGRLFDRALLEAGISRTELYITNAVKHFKFEPRGRRRLHKTPGQIEIDACRTWLEQELALVQPRVVVALGATAARSLLGTPAPIQRNRGRLLRLGSERQLLVTVHPSYLLRVAPEKQSAEFARFVEDLRLLRPYTTDRTSERGETLSAGSPAHA
jgi:DNA polymerase